MSFLEALWCGKGAYGVMNRALGIKIVGYPTR